MLIGISELISKSWELYKTNFKRLIPYMGIYFAAGLITIAGGAALEFLTRYSITNTVSASISLGLSIIRSVLVLWVVSATVKCIASVATTGTFLAWRESFDLTKGMLIALILNAFLVTIALFCGLILLIVPGIIFAVWFVFVSHEVILNKQGTSILDVGAITRSKQLVSGRFFDIAFTYYIPPFVFGLIFGIINLILVIIFAVLGSFISTTAGVIAADVIGTLGSAAFIPLPVITGVLLYLSARENPVPPPQPVTPKTV